MVYTTLPFIINMYNIIILCYNYKKIGIMSVINISCILVHALMLKKKYIYVYMY